MPRTLAERIQEAEAQLITTKDTLTEATELLEAAPDDETVLAQVQELTLQIEGQTKMLGTLQNAETALALKARPAGAGTVLPSGQGVAPAVNRFPALKTGGELIWKHAVAEMISYVSRIPVMDVIKARYDDDERVGATYMAAKMLTNEKGAVAPALTTVPAWAGALVREDTRGFIESLQNTSVAAALSAQTLSLDFDGFGSIKIPVENPLPNTPTEPAWVGEGGVIPLTAFSFGSTTMNPYKLAAISTMSREIVERSNPAIEQVVQNSLRKAYSKVLDQALLTSTITAIVNVRPAALTNGIAALVPSAGAPDANVRSDIFKLLSALTAAGLGEKPVLITNNLDLLGARMLVNAMGEFVYRAELANGTLLSIPVIFSGNVPKGTVVMVDAAYVATAFGGIDFNVSDVATVTEAGAHHAPPTQGSIGGVIDPAGNEGTVPVMGGIPVAGVAGAATAGYTARSLWQTYSLGVRMVAVTSWAKMNAAAVQWMQNVVWA